MTRTPKTPAAPAPFDPVSHMTSEQDDFTLADYLQAKLGLGYPEIERLTRLLGRDGAVHEVWEELVARRRKAGR